MSKTHTRGNVIVEDIQIGDIHYEFEYAIGIKVEVVSLPVLTDGYYTWQSRMFDSDRIIDYGVSIGHSHYAPNLYDHEAYIGCRIITK